MEGIQVAAGSVVGKDHIVMNLGNQDAFSVVEGEDCVIAVVCDGCGSYQFSGFGARLGANFIANQLTASMPFISVCQRRDVTDELSDPNSRFWNSLRFGTIKFLRTLAHEMWGPGHEAMRRGIINNFLFTVVVGIVTREKVVVMMYGDGFCAINGRAWAHQRFPGNAPPYIAYEIPEFEWHKTKVDQNDLKFKFVMSEHGDTFEHMLIASDGIDDIVKKTDELMPKSTGDKVGPISQFWTRDAYFDNPDELRRKLFLMNKQAQKIDWENKRLIKSASIIKDDTTIVVARRTSCV